MYICTRHTVAKAKHGKSESERETIMGLWVEGVEYIRGNTLSLSKKLDGRKLIDVRVLYTRKSQERERDVKIGKWNSQQHKREREREIATHFTYANEE